MKILYNLEEIQELKDLAVYHHLGLGDHIHCNGIINYILNNYKINELIIFCKYKNYLNVYEIYKDYEQVCLIAVDDTNEFNSVYEFIKTNNLQCLCIGHDAYKDSMNELEKINGESWCDQIFYNQLKIPYINRYELFKYDRNIKKEIKYFNSLEVKPLEYVFIHQYPERNFDKFLIERKLNKKFDLPIVYNDPNVKIFDLGYTIENAKEFYCLESSLRCYVEHLDCKNVDLYLYTGYCDIYSATNKNWIRFK